VSRDRVLAGAGVAAVAVLGAVVVMVLWNGGGTPGPEPTVTGESGIEAYADLDAYQVQFGDTVTAKIEVTVDRSRVDPDSIRLNTDFTPWKPIGAPETLRHDGKSTTYLETRYTLRCLESFCTTQDETGVQDFRAARVTYSALGDRSVAGARTLQAAWPDLLVSARYAPPGASQGVRQPATRWQADLVSLPAATYRLGPWLLVVLLLAGAVLFAGAAVALFARTRPRAAPTVVAAPAQGGGPVLTPLEYALRLLEDSSRVNGSGDQRRALELVADGLVHRGDGPLARTARALAWSRPVPKIDETQGLARRARKVLQEEEELDAAFA
jgi:hypothetical protein